MKKLIILISTLALMMSLCACSGQARGAESGSASPEPEISAQPVSEEPTQDLEPSEEPLSAPPEETEVPEPSEDVQPSAASETSAPTSTPAVASTPAPTAAPPSTPEPPPSSEPTSPPTLEPTSEPTSAADPKTVAQSLIGHPVSELYAAIGRPNAADYAPGCVEPDSEDGELFYSGFTVYTVRTATREYVYDVL